MTGAHKEDGIPTPTLGASLARLAANATRRYTPPALSPEFAQGLDADQQYARWVSSPEAETFRSLDTAGQAARATEEVARRCWNTLTQVNSGGYETRAAILEVTPLITEYADALSVVWENLDAPFSLPPVRTVDDPMVPYLAGFRALARLLALDAARRVQHSDGDGALEVCRVGLRFGLQVARGSNLLGRLTSLSLQSLCRRFLWAAMPHASAPALSATRHELYTAFANAFPFSETVTVEGRFVLRNLLRSWETPALFEDTVKPASDLPLHLVTLLRGKNHVFDNVVKYLDAWKDVGKGPYRNPSELPTAPASISPSVFGDTYFSEMVQTTQNRLALTALALHQYRVDLQVWPLRLDALCPNYLDTLPHDPFRSREPLQYRRDGTGYLLYSVGPDGEEDNGRAIAPFYDIDTRVMSHCIWQASRGDIVAGVNV